jgi:acyl carrier protein
MGLDIVEYVLAVEDAFEIALDDADLSRIRTVGEFHQLVLKEIRWKQPHGRAGSTPRTVCVSSRAFYRLRQALITTGVANRKQVARKTSLESLISRRDRRAIWDELARSMRCALPRLERPDLLCGVLVLGSALAVLCLTTIGALRPDAGRTPWLVVAGVGLPVLSFVLSKPRAVEFHRNCQTVEGLVEWLVLKQRPRFAEPDRDWTDREVWETICRLLVEMQGLKPEQITPEATFVDDLGMD